MPVTRLNTFNGWIDEFDTGRAMGRLQDGDMGYRVFENIEHDGARETRMFINANHWMVDTGGGNNGGALLRPSRAFRFEDGVLVIEADVAAAIPEYEDSAAVEVDVTMAPEPTGKVVDLQYGYGLFGGAWTRSRARCSTRAARPATRLSSATSWGVSGRCCRSSASAPRTSGATPVKAAATTSARACRTRWTCTAATAFASSSRATASPCS
jgi:hypothetical protein